MLNDQQLKDIESLKQVCEQHDESQLKLNEEMLKSRKNDLDDFLTYDGDNLIGFLGLYGFGTSYELCGMIHPEFRRRGIFQDLFGKALKSLKERGVTKLLINAPGSSESGRAFIETTSAQYSFSEYQMKWKPKDMGNKNTDVKLIPAASEDNGLILDLDYLCFNIERDDSIEFMEMVKNDPGRSSFIIQYNGEKVGKIHVQREGSRSYIFGFAVHPDQQGKGIGRKVLANTVIEENKSGQDIFLEVAANNAHALKLYEGAGFVSYQVQDYYEYKGL